jgi:hypothetical protein
MFFCLDLFKKFMSYFIIFLFFILVLVVISKKTAKRDKYQIVEINNTNSQNRKDSYQLYCEWCVSEKHIPIAKVDFDKLADKNESINLADLMLKHNELNNMVEKSSGIDTVKEKDSNINTNVDLNNKIQKERDNDFALSLLSGYSTDSTLKGTVIGGSLLGASIGDYLNNKTK